MYADCEDIGPDLASGAPTSMAFCLRGRSPRPSTERVNFMATMVASSTAMPVGLRPSRRNDAGVQWPAAAGALARRPRTATVVFRYVGAEGAAP